MEGQEVYGPGSWGITHVSCKLSVDIDFLNTTIKTPILQPALREVSDVGAVADDWWMNLSVCVAVQLTRAGRFLGVH